MIPGVPADESALSLFGMCVGVACLLLAVLCFLVWHENKEP
jgi:hypothetical protein